MKYQKILEMTDKFITLAMPETVYQSPTNIEFQAQRIRFAQIYEYFKTTLRAILGELSGEIWTLKHLKFSSKIFLILSKLYAELILIYKEIEEEKPYPTIEKLIHLVLEPYNLAIIDNLDFLSKHHLKQNKVNFEAGQTLKHPEMEALEKLKELAMHLKEFMLQHPLIKTPGPSKPPIGLRQTMEEIPAFLAGQEDKTKI